MAKYAVRTLVLLQEELTKEERAEFVRNKVIKRGVVRKQLLA